MNSKFLFGFIIGFLYCVITFGNKKEGSTPNISINLPPFIINGHIMLFGYHIHHWLIFSIILFCIRKYNYNILKGFSVFMILHGLSYNDWYKFKD